MAPHGHHRIKILKLVLFFLAGEVAGFDISNVVADSVGDVLAKGAIGTQIAGLELLSDT